MKPETIIELDRGPKAAPKAQVVRVSVREYQGRRFADVRVYFQDGPSGYKPSGKGIALRLQEVAEVAAGLDRALTRLVELEEAS